MKTEIIITGQISGNFTLRSAIYYDECTSLPFSGFCLKFKTKKDAKKALWEAFKLLRSDREDAKNSRLSYSKNGSLRYDASRATLTNQLN